MKETKITCDYCGADLTSTISMPKYRLALTAEPLPVTSGTVNAVRISPPIKQTHHFCNLTCLFGWVQEVGWGAREITK